MLSPPLFNFIFLSFSLSSRHTHKLTHEDLLPYRSHIPLLHLLQQSLFRSRTISPTHASWAHPWEEWSKEYKIIRINETVTKFVAQKYFQPFLSNVKVFEVTLRRHHASTPVECDDFLFILDMDVSAVSPSFSWVVVSWVSPVVLWGKIATSTITQSWSTWWWCTPFRCCCWQNSVNVALCCRFNETFCVAYST